MPRPHARPAGKARSPYPFSLPTPKATFRGPFRAIVSGAVPRREEQAAMTLHRLTTGMPALGKRGVRRQVPPALVDGLGEVLWGMGSGPGDSARLGVRWHVWEAFRVPMSGRFGLVDTTALARDCSG